LQYPGGHCILSYFARTCQQGSLPVAALLPRFEPAEQRHLFITRIGAYPPDLDICRDLVLDLMFGDAGRRVGEHK